MTQWLLLLMVAAETAALMVTMKGLRTVVNLGPRTRRLRLRRFIRAGGWWEITVGIYMVMERQWVYAPALFGVGLMMLGMSRMWGKHPWMTG